MSTASTAAVITNDIYSLDPIIKQWRRHTSSSSYRYLHSAVASSGLMIVFGGNTHNDTSWSHGAKCYSADVLAYDMVCDKWYNMGSSLPTNLDVDLPRFGHSAVMLNGTMVLYGGFHGVLKNDTLIYVPGKCEMFKIKFTCLEANAGIKCAWNSKKSACEMHPPHRAKSGLETCLVKRPDKNETSTCDKLKSCSACTSTSFGCVWCRGDCKWLSCHPDNAAAQRKGRVNYGFSEDNAKEGDQSSESHVASFKVPTAAEAPYPSVSRPDECPGDEGGSTAKEWCPRLHTCHSCAATQNCQWDVGKISHCKESKAHKLHSAVAAVPSASKNLTTVDHHIDYGSKKTTLSEVAPPMSSCSPACSERTTCSNCTHGLCMWCKNLGMCIDRNAYLASFPYGQCMDWTTQTDQCPPPAPDNSEYN